MADIWNDFKPHPEIAVTRQEYDAALAAFKASKGITGEAPDLHKHPEFQYKACYKYDYVRIFTDIAAGKIDHRGTFQKLIQTDRFFVAYFIAGWETGKVSGNKPFIVNQCQALEDGPESGTVDIWAREHGKSSTITIAHTVQRIVRDPESTTAIFSYKKPAAEKFLDSVRKILELPIMVWCFPDILYENPSSQAPSWSLQGGIRVKRTNTTRREHTVEAFGLVEGMPTGGHFDHRIYDDVETDDLAKNPEQLDICFDKLEMSRNLGVEGGTEQVIGTYYSHCGVLTKLRDKKDIHGKPMYQLRIHPATDDGTIHGKPVFFSQAYLDSKKTDSSFNTQQLCNPTPGHAIKLNFERFQYIEPHKLPKDRLKFIIIDPAGDADVQTGAGNDIWSMICISVKPMMDELGNSDVFLEDAIIGQMSISMAVEAARNIYTRNGRIALLAVERVATDSAWKHIKNGLEAKGRYLELKKKGKYGGNLLLLSPKGRTKNYRIETALSWPLNNSKLHLSTELSEDVIEELEQECNKFPFFHVDVLDAMAYLYDILEDPTFTFAVEGDEDDDGSDPYDDQYSGRSKSAGY